MRPLLLSLATLLVCACPGKPAVIDPPPPPPPPAPETLVVDHWTKVAIADAGSGAVGPNAIGWNGRRLTVHQLERSLEASLGTRWRMQFGAREMERDAGVDVPFDVLIFVGPSLGRADYLTEFRESSDIGPTFTKMMDNWASQSCVDAVLADVNRPAADRRVMEEVPEAALPDGGTSTARRATILENARLARLHLQSVYTPPAAAEAELGHLVTVFETVAARFRRGDPMAMPVIIPALPAPQADIGAMAAVCTLLATDPEFVTY
jgi:hypothetical protein